MKIGITILKVFIVLLVLEITTLRMWTHPAFILLLAGVVAMVYHKITGNKIQKRRVHHGKVQRA